MIRMPPQLPAVCDTCGYRRPYDKITPACYEVLRLARGYKSSAAELEMLHKVAAFYQRNPLLEGRIRPHAIKAFLSRDPKAIKQMFAGVPLAEVDLPPEPPIDISHQHPDDTEVIAYLEANSFNLQARLRGFPEHVEKCRRAVGRVKCPKCKAGTMQLLAESDGQALDK